MLNIYIEQEVDTSVSSTLCGLQTSEVMVCKAENVTIRNLKRTMDLI